MKNSKKILKNIKFGLRVHIHMEIMLNGSDGPLGLLKCRYESIVRSNIRIHSTIASLLCIYSLNSILVSTHSILFKFLLIFQVCSKNIKIDVNVVSAVNNCFIQNNSIAIVYSNCVSFQIRCYCIHAICGLIEID